MATVAAPVTCIAVSALEAGGGQQDSRRPADNRGGARAPQSDYRFGGRFWVVVDSDGEREFRNVTTGITDLEQVEIVDGLEEGESVLILPSTHLVETQQELQKWINRRIGSVPGIR